MAARILTRRILPLTTSRLLLIGNANGSIRHLVHRNPRNLPDLFFGSTSNLFGELEKEFDRMQRRFDKYFRNYENEPQSLTTYPKFSANGNDMIVTQSDGSRKFHLAFDIRGFEPEEVKIKTQNRTLMISAKKEKRNDNSYSLHEFSQSYSLPEDLKLEDLKSTYSDNGILTIEAPLPKAEPKERQIEIEHSK